MTRIPAIRRVKHRPRMLRAGFTILELFVVVAVIGILVALLLPAVQQVREAARRSQCQSNLHQIGVALHNFEASETSLPAGCDFQNYWLHSWNMRILPYLDQAPLYNQYNWTKVWDDPWTNENVTCNNLPVFVCPSAITNLTGETDYGGNYGSGKTGLRRGLLMGQAWESGALVGINIGVRGERKRPVRFGEFADGLSTTFLVLESTDRQAGNGSWGIGTNCLAIEYPINDRTAGHDGETILSRHVLGGFALFSDGHVAFLSNSTDLYVLGSLSTRAGGETAQP